MVIFAALIFTAELSFNPHNRISLYQFTQPIKLPAQYKTKIHKLAYFIKSKKQWKKTFLSLQTIKTSKAIKTKNNYRSSSIKTIPTSQILNQQGSMTLPGILIILAIVTLFLSHLHGRLESHKNNIATGENLLCIKQQLRLRQNYMQFMQKTNLAIKVAKAASLVPATRIVGSNTLKALKLSQEIKKMRFKVKLHFSSLCKKSHLISPRANPYTKNMKYKRALDETARLLYKKDNITVISKVNKAIIQYSKISYSTKWRGGLKLKGFSSKNMGTFKLKDVSGLSSFL